jgi:hypothetical protein
MDLFGLVLDQEHVHHLKCVPYRFGSSVVVKVHPDLSSLQFDLLDLRRPELILLFLVIAIKPMVILLLTPCTDVIVPAVESDVRMTCSLLCADMEPR